MKKLIGFLVAYCLYGLGHLCSIGMHSTAWKKLALLYPYYNRLMIASLAVQDWSGANGPWKTVK